MNTTPARLCLLATALAAGPASALSIAPAYGVIVCTVAGTSGQYSVRVQNTGAVPLARADVTGVRLDAGGHAAGEIGVSLTDIAPGKYETAVLARHGESAALVSIATYQSMNDQLVREEELYAGKVAHVSPGSALQYTLAPLATRGWTVAYGTAQPPALKTGAAVLLAYPRAAARRWKPARRRAHADPRGAAEPLPGTAPSLNRPAQAPASRSRSFSSA